VKSIVLGLLLGVLVAYPHLLLPVATLAQHLAAQPLLWSFVAGVIARPRIARRLTRRLL
jgi:hypothetical protein